MDTLKLGRKLTPMNTQPFDDSNWREEYKGYTSSRYELDILENGPKSLAQSWMLGALHGKWRKMKGYKYPEPPDCQSSMSELFKKQDEYQQKGDQAQDFTPENDPYGGY